jgi:pentatricopeptide repeat protein
MAKFLDYCDQQPMRGHQAAMLQRGYEYLKSRGARVKGEILSKVLEALSRGVEKEIELLPVEDEHLRLARLIWKDLRELDGYQLNKKDMQHFTSILSISGRADEARKLLKKNPEVASHKSWAHVLSGFMRKDNEWGVLETMKYLRSQPEDIISPYLYFYPVEFYCTRNDLENAHVWYKQAIEDGKQNVLPAYVAILEACIRTGQLAWGRQLVQKLLNDEKARSKKEVSEVILRFQAAQCRDEEELQRLVDEMKSRGEPDFKTIKSLVSAALAQNNHEAVDKINALLAEHGLQMDRSTLELRLQDFINCKDFAGAYAVFEDLKYTQDIPADYTGDVPQALLRAMAENYPQCDLSELGAIYEDLMEMKILLKPDTLLPLVDVYLQEEAFENVKDLLNKHVGHFAPRERQSVIDLLVAHGQRETTSVEGAWSTYLQLVRSFPETPLSGRHKFMNLFFEQNRPFAAVRILEHMGMTDDRKPTKYQYTAAFVGIGNSRSLQCLQKVERMMNMDAFVEVDTILRNAIMFAYAKCGLLKRAYDVYVEITRTEEGPDHATISQVFDVCGRMADGGLWKAKKLWAGYRRMGVPLTENNVTSYVEALCKHGAWDDAWDVVKDMEQDLGLPPGPRVYVSSLLLVISCVYCAILILSKAVNSLLVV